MWSLVVLDRLGRKPKAPEPGIAIGSHTRHFRLRLRFVFLCSLVSFGFIWYTWQCDLKRHDAIPGKDFRRFDCGAMAAKAANIARTVVLSSRLLPETVRTLGLGGFVILGRNNF